MKRLRTATEELAKRVETLEQQSNTLIQQNNTLIQQNNTFIHRLKIVEQQKDTGWQRGARLSSEVRDLVQANTEIRENMRKLSEDTHETVGPVRLKTIFENFLGEWGWTRRHRANWCEQTYKEKDGLLTNKTLMYLNNTYAKETPDSTAHSTTFSKGYAAVEMEYESGRMSDDDYLAFL